jgi:hypothetical protein
MKLLQSVFPYVNYHKVCKKKCKKQISNIQHIIMRWWKTLQMGGRKFLTTGLYSKHYDVGSL